MQKKFHKLHQEGEENIENFLKLNPLFLPDNKDVNKVADILLPCITGIEIECDKSTNYKEENFSKIEGILEVRNDNSEQRYKVTNGLLGFKALYNLCETLKENSLPNYESGIHYHIDFTGDFDLLTEDGIKHIEDFVLKELDTWDYKGTYNKRRFGYGFGFTWVRSSTKYKTIEFRIGEMTFDYALLVKRILHLQQIVIQIKYNLKLFQLSKQDTTILKEKINVQQIIKNRKILL